MAFLKWGSIEKFSDIYHKAQKYRQEEATYRGKIKLHGTNACIRVEGGATELVGQKRTSDVSVGSDNAGFAAWLSTVDFVNTVVPGMTMYIYGEWAGPGIQAGDAVANIPRKTFFPFCIVNVFEDEDKNTIVIEPETIRLEVGAIFGERPDIVIVPWGTPELTFNFLKQEEAQAFITEQTKIVDEEISKEDPFIMEAYDISGPGEGLVFYRTDVTAVDLVKSYMFKLKTEAHSVNKSKKRDHVAPEKPEGIDEFIDMFFTEARFEQMLIEIGGADRKKTGEFLKAVMSDAHKESVNEIELADFEWKDVAKYSVNKTKAWFFDKCDEL